MIVTTGGRCGGFGLYLLKGNPVFDYNALMPSQPFFHSGVRILVPRDRTGQLVAALANLATPAHALMLLGLLCLVAAMSAGIYVLARRHDASDFPATRIEGVVESLYIAAVALLKGQLDRKLLPGAAGRLLTIVWMVFGTALVAYVSAAIAAVLTVHHLTNKVQEFDDLVGKPVAALAGHQTVGWLRRRGIDVVEQPDVDAAVEALLARRVDAVVHDTPALAWWRGHHPSVPVLTVGRTFDYKDYAIALARESQLRLRINVALFALQEAGFFDELDHRWFGSAGR